MWTTQLDHMEAAGTLRLRFLDGTSCLNYAEFLQALLTENDFRELVITQLEAAPFTAFRWETPPLTSDTLDQAFSCVLHDSPDLDVPADPIDFQSYFDTEQEVVCFENLGADALLIVPCPTCESSNYSHIASFHRSAPHSQIHALWQTVAQTVLEQVDQRPRWLSTAGGGVDWLHMRLDDRPKYYRHQPWRDWPAAESR